ncbi:MAG: electron transfer flavoprotein subunit beta/FixA family protein, partial [Bacillota bacterium]
MKILVLVKETISTDTKMVIDRKGNVVPIDDKYIINPFDEFAIEEGMRIKEKFGGEVVLLSAGREETSYLLRSGLALGADRALLVMTEEKDSMTICEALKEAIEKEGDFDIILAGWISSDSNNAQVTGRLSQELNIPLVNLVTKIDINLDCHTAISEREGDVFLEIVETKLPSMFAVQKGINKPRYPRLIDIVDVRKKKIDIMKHKSKNNQFSSIITYSVPSKKKKQILMNDSDSKKTVELLIK